MWVFGVCGEGGEEVGVRREECEEVSEVLCATQWGVVSRFQEESGASTSSSLLLPVCEELPQGGEAECKGEYRCDIYIKGAKHDNRKLYNITELGGVSITNADDQSLAKCKKIAHN